MLPVAQAETIILDRVQSLDSRQDVETIDLGASLNRILAIPVVSALDFPHWDNSAMDGYAVRFADVETVPVTLAIVEEIPAGYQPQMALQKGQAARIFTGAILPQGADTVIMQENTEREGERVKILQSPQPQEFVRHRAAFYEAGTPLLPPGIKIGAAEMAVLAAAQCTEVTVYRQPRVALFSTGDELVSADKPLQPGQIVDSNQYALAAFVTQMGGISVPLGIVRDREDKLEEAIARAVKTADVVLSTGGVSVGEYDLVGKILQKLGGEIQIRKVAIKPGKPLTVATFPGTKSAKPCLYFGIPGNPVSALVSCWRFVQPALKKLSGLKGNWQPNFVTAKTVHSLKGAGQRDAYLWGKLRLEKGQYQFELAGGSHSSGNLINLAQTNGLAIVPAGVQGVNAGEIVTVMQV
ncbi:MAG: molybdopterin molybdotransferase MoeA [Jaaginema sp. PMC 1079.18]|nr:molybdopterin molybdotransferase MoeA [Jaaginema sp. PMC 1080.18]MEC4849729.1 molybdopterin molybdotransferase MoeA [Jaaginema sp. PMC 1079.18]MEC4867698.1 molybdopterin molybdotransferase MoeA [Jaaginema sp. PMC 1078.18]